MHRAVFIVCLFSVLSLFSACDSVTEPVIEDFGRDYFPLEIGHTLIYQVDSVIFDTTGMGIIIDSSRSYLKEEIVESFPNNAGGTSFRIQRSIKQQLEDPWVAYQNWSAETNDLKAIRTEDNLRFIKMVFPLVENSFWDGNRFIDKTINVVIAGETVEIFKNWEYELITIGETEQIGRFAFDEVATISQADNENLIELRYSREKYAKGIGLVYKEMRILDTQNISDSLPWFEKAQKGFILIQTLIDHN